ncbi:MAG: DinB family protein [Gemmatimonadetes bacterium]|nr:DinB family protein [Gemmatimonadota bacterium]
MPAVFTRPAADEFAPFYAGYVAKVPEGALPELLDRQIDDIEATLRPLPPHLGTFAYAPGKWTINEVIGHLADGERVFGYRMLTFARHDATPLPAFDDNAWTPAGQFNDRALTNLLDELIAARRATIAMVNGLPADAPTRRGTASGREISVRALGFIMYGHVAHHLEIMKARYL